MKHDNSLNPQTLSALFPLGFMTEAERELLPEQIALLRGKRGAILIESGKSDNKALYVLKGKIKVEGADGTTEIYEDGAPQLKRPISFTNPHKLTVTCLNTVEYFRLDNHIIANLLERKNRRDVQADNIIQQSLIDNPLFASIYKDLEADKLNLPTLPKIAMGVRNAIENDAPVRKIEVLVQSDPAMATLLIKTANSALYRTRNTASTIEQAIMRMGLRTVKNLVTGYSLKHLFKTSNQYVKKHMKDVWIHNAEVAAVSFVLAKHLHKFDPEQALLMGLLHNVGVLPILTYAEKYPDIINDEVKLMETIKCLKAEVGAIILSKWQFSDDFITVAKESENWFRDNSDQADYCDLVLVAQLHTYIGRKHQNGEFPKLYEVPAFKKLGLGQDDPDKGISIIADANEQINEVRQLLSI